MTSCCRSLSRAPCPRNPELLSQATRIELASPPGAGGLGSGRGPGVESERESERGTQSPADPSAARPPALCKEAWDQQPTGTIHRPHIPLLTRLPLKGRPPPPKVHPRVDDSAGHRPHPDPAPAAAGEGPGASERLGSKPPRPNPVLTILLFATVCRCGPDSRRLLLHPNEVKRLVRGLKKKKKKKK